MRRAANVDANQEQIVAALRRIGASVAVTSAVGSGFPDLVVGFRGINVLLEIKDGAKVQSKRQLTKDQERWHAAWAGQVSVVETPEGAVTAVVLAAKRAGQL